MLAQDVGDVPVNGVVADRELEGDLVVVAAAAYQTQDLRLPRGERSGGLPGTAAASRPASASSAVAPSSARTRVARASCSRVPAVSPMSESLPASLSLVSASSWRSPTR